jgi:endoribonuclease Dicer
MSLGSGFLENLPHFTFTPAEHQVECVRVAGGRNLTFVLTQPQEKSFLVLMLVREAASTVRGGGGKAALLVHEAEQVPLWTSFLTRMTDLAVAGLADGEALDTGQVVEAAGVLVTTHATFSVLLARKHLDMSALALLVVDNVQASFQTTETAGFLAEYLALPRNRSPRLVSITPNILTSNSDSSLARLPRQLERLGSLVPAAVECACEIATQLRYLARPQEVILLYGPGQAGCPLEAGIRALLATLRDWVEDQNYSLYDTYGDEFGDLIADIPDPTIAPLQIIRDFEAILTELGVWCADRAALILMIKIDKLKTREKYERHFLLLSILFTLMVRIRKLCDDTYGELGEAERLERYGRPKLHRLVALLKLYSPEPKEEAKETKEAEEVAVTPAALGGRPQGGRRRGGGRRAGSVPEDPDTLCALLIVDSAFSAKILYHYLKDLSRARPELTFLCPQYAVSDPIPADPRDVENERKKQEEALRRFRMRECNILVSSSVLEMGIDFVKCNLVILFDHPGTFHRYVYTKVKCKSVGGSLVHLATLEAPLTRDLQRFRALERCIVAHCTNLPAEESEDIAADRAVGLLPGFPAGAAPPPLTLNTSVLVLNRYCAKLPSDSFTRLTPSWTVEEAVGGGFYCAIFLPINSPLKRLVVGQVMPSQALARRAAAYSVCVALRQLGELDPMMLPLGKESVLPPAPPRPDWAEEAVRPGTTKRRQYYYKRVAECLTMDEPMAAAQTDCQDGPVDDLIETLQTTAIEENPTAGGETEKAAEPDRNARYYEAEEDPALKAKFSGIRCPGSLQYSLYRLRMTLTCPIPEEQNTRGRRIHDPRDSRQSFGLLLPRGMPACPSFPIYTRSGEVVVSVELVQKDMSFSPEQLALLFTFHVFTFSSVLRLEKYPLVYSAEAAQNCVVVVPLLDTSRIDWTFLGTISRLATRRLRALPDTERSGFTFRAEDFQDAVIMPWYRNQDQPQYFYVAEICDHLSPASDFPGQGFETFALYYFTKYGIRIQTTEQPLLDVDHTSARLNFLTPRYVNRKGIALPTSSEETKRNKRENLDQKQILVPELCAIHPFPASLWRQTVSLPCTLYRLNGLLLADQIRRQVARELRLGLATVPEGFVWPALNFGWTLADVVRQGKESPGKAEGNSPAGKAGKKAIGGTGNCKEEMGEFGEWTGEEDMDIVAEKLIKKLAEEERMVKKKNLEIGTWSNEMAAEPEFSAPGLEGAGLDWGADQEEPGSDDDLAGVELPDNLTFISSQGADVPCSPGGKKDWGTGIQARNFRVGSPTMYGGGPQGLAGRGLLEDLEGFSCSDSDDSMADEEETDTEVEREGGARIEFHGENLAEAIEGEDESQRREERVARDRDQEAAMVKNSAWDPAGLCDPGEEGEEELGVEVEVTVIREDQPVAVTKPSRLMVKTVPEATSGSAFQPRAASPDQELVLRHLGLAPDLDLVKPAAAEPAGVIPWPGIDPDKQFSFDEQPDLEQHPGPSPSLILQALTMSNSNDAINLERLETIGDSFLKYAITSYLFCSNPNIHEGKLSHLRSKQVSNLNLYQLGRARGLGECMIATKFEPHDNWLPPGYHVPRELEQALIESGVPANRWNIGALPNVESLSSQAICDLLKERGGELLDKDIPNFIPYNLLTQHSIPDKSIADCVEALIGAYLIACGPRGALLLMTWLGVAVLPADGSPLQPPPSPLLASPAIGQPERQLHYLLDGFNKFEHMIGYVWRDKCYLLQAFSHASYYPNRLTDCYQRLEFLGDAVLDYLITRHLYQDPRLHSPGALTDLRSALVNNTIFACLAVRHQFHKFFKHLSPGLQTVCDRFVRIQAENGWRVSEECYLIEEEETEEAEDIEVPKALGDIFESVAGSIFLDSGLSLDAVWRVYYRMMREEIDQFTSHVPKSPIRELLELEPETAKFGKPEKLADGRRVRVSVEVFGKGVFKVRGTLTLSSSLHLSSSQGIGRNYRIAKCTAAKCALKALKKMDAKDKRKK